MPLDNQSSDQVSYDNHIPEAVRRASARADDLARAVGAAGVPELEPQPESMPLVAEPVAEPEQPQSQLLPEPAPAPPEYDWEQRYRTLQGKYDREIPALHGRLASLEQLLAATQAPLRAEPATPVPTTTVVIPPEDEETYGAELIAAARRWAMAEVQPRIAQLEHQLGELRGGQQQIRTETVQSRIERALDADSEIAVRWRELNHDPEFLAWLAQVDPFAGEPRQMLLNKAAGAGDAARCIRFFKTYLAEHTAVTQPSPAVSAQTAPVPAQAEPRPTLESLAAPGRPSGSAPSGAPAEKRVWTNPQITAFYRACTNGDYRTREAEKIRIEEDIIAAAREGRIRQ